MKMIQQRTGDHDRLDATSVREVRSADRFDVTEFQRFVDRIGDVDRRRDGDSPLG